LVPIKKNTAYKNSVFLTGSLLDLYPNLPEVDAMTNAPKVTKFPMNLVGSHKKRTLPIKTVFF
tara:strand:+ start:264 stop:452 length:189 start_codon:yes stop_codon:yes gene_type:complete